MQEELNKLKDENERLIKELQIQRNFMEERKELIELDRRNIIRERALSHGVSFEVMQKVVEAEEQKWDDYMKSHEVG